VLVKVLGIVNRQIEVGVGGEEGIELVVRTRVSIPAIKRRRGVALRNEVERFGPYRSDERRGRLSSV
jgi:hypothetical protein